MLIIKHNMGREKRFSSELVSTSYIFILILHLFIYLPGCSTSDKKTDREVAENVKEVEGIDDIKLTDFTLGAGDSVEINVYRKKFPEPLLSVGDTLEIFVYRNEQLSRKIMIDYSGKIMFPMIGDVQAAGVSIFELRDKIRDRLANYILDPQVTVNVSSTESRKISDLSKTVKIDSTGMISFPILGNLEAAGKDVFELRDTIKNGLSTYIMDPQVTIDVTSIKSSKVMVLGEVNNPGVYTLDSPKRLFEILLNAGGVTDDAKLKNVLLIRKSAGQSNVESLNLKSLYKEGDLTQNAFLKSGDIVYVPKVLISNVSWFFQHLSKIVSPLVNTESGIILWPKVKDVFKGEDKDTNFSIQAR